MGHVYKREPGLGVVLPLSTAVVPSLALFGVLVLMCPRWAGLENSASGYLVLAGCFFIPLLTLCVRPAANTKTRWLSLGLSGLAATLFFLHGGLSAEIVRAFDAGFAPRPHALEAALAVFLSSTAVPIGLFLAPRLAGGKKLWEYVIAPAVTGAAGQLIWFAVVRIIEGPSGMDYWLISRTMVHAGLGAVTGLLVGGTLIYSTPERISIRSGPTEIFMRRLPRAPYLAAILLGGLMAAGGVRLVGEMNNTNRFAIDRIDEYFLALSNLRTAKEAGLVYPQLKRDYLDAKKALIGSSEFDPLLPSLFERMIANLEANSPEPSGSADFKQAVLAVNLRLLAKQVPFFLEPHELDQGGKKTRFLLRYKITRRENFFQRNLAPVPMLRLRRIDDLLIDTPYTGLSYPGLGTVLMDHVDDSALRTHGRLFARGAVTERQEDGEFARTRSLIRKDRRDALKAHLQSRGLAREQVLTRVANTALNWEKRPDVFGVRSVMDTDTLAAYDALAEVLARQTEVHEARHALDREQNRPPLEFEELAAGSLSDNAVAETRAHLTEIVDGPLGPKFALATIADLVAGDYARANAYFFAGVVILEGMWEQKIRKPDVIEEDGANGPVQVVMPICKEHPGWLSYSRINSCYDSLRNLPDDLLRKRAADLFEKLFDETYSAVRKE